MDIEDIIKSEGRNVEFKLELPQKDVTFLKTAVAFANCQGGRFVFGIRNEDHAVIGMDDDTLFQDMDTITNIVSDNCEPAIMPNVYPLTLEGKSLIIVEIDVGRQRPYYVKSFGMMDGTFIRVAAETRKAEEYMVKELMFEGAHRFFDKTVCLGLEATDDDINALCRSLQETAGRYRQTKTDSQPLREVTRNQLLSWGILTKKDNQIVPTNSFALLTGHYLLPVMTQCAVFKGTTKGNFIDKREYEGPIQEQQEEAFQFVLRNIKLGARIKGLYRQDVYEIPPDAIREILVDAVVHRSYLATGNIQVALYDDRLEVMSPGKLPIDQTIESMKNGCSKIRNEAIAKAFAYMGLIEGWGSGIPKINKLLQEAGLQEMEISGGDFFMKFTIYRNLDFDPLTVESNVVVTDPVATVTDSVTDPVATMTDPVTDPVATMTDPVTIATDPVAAPVTIATDPVADPVTDDGSFTLTLQVKALLQALAHSELSPAELRSILHISHRKTFRDNYMHPCLQFGLIEPTQPDVPQSPTQKYHLTAKGINLLEKINNLHN